MKVHVFGVGELVCGQAEFEGYNGIVIENVDNPQTVGTPCDGKEVSEEATFLFFADEDSVDAMIERLQITKQLMKESK